MKYILKQLPNFQYLGKLHPQQKYHHLTNSTLKKSQNLKCLPNRHCHLQ